MLPMQAVRLALGTLLSSDADTLAPASNANKIHLVSSPFSPSEDLQVSDLTFATFTGSTAKAGSTGDQGVGIDPTTNQQVITITAPAGGWRWECTADPGSPETIYGYALTDNAGTTLLGVELFPNPLSVSQSGDVIDLGAVIIDFVLQPMM